MPQLSLYIDDATMETLRSSAKGEGVSMSKYAAELIRTRSESGAWPKEYWDSVYGCLDDESFAVNDGTLDASLDDNCDWFE